ncbi:MAG: putative dehydrogenase [Bacilli bacterium]|nr:putative dehydrogenase [Bacilli bacterium]
MSREIGYAIVGLGVGKTHVKAAVRARGVKFVALCDLDQEVLNKVGDEHNIDPANRYTDFAAVLARPDIEVVSICTPSGLHADMAIQALKAGKHVLVEKPLDVTLGQIDKVVQAAEQSNRFLGCVFQNRLSPGNRKIKELVDSGRLGQLVTANFHVKWYRTDTYYANNGGWRGTWAMDGGGALMNQSVHTIDLMQWFMGPVKSVFAKTGTYNHNIECEDLGVALVTFENGAVGTLIGTTSAYPGLEVLVQIHGTTGAVYAKNSNIETWKLADDPDRTEEAEVLAQYKAGEKKSGGADPNAISTTGHAGQIQDMIFAVIEDRPPMIQGKEGRNAVEIILAIYESARTGKEVFLPLN